MSESRRPHEAAQATAVPARLAPLTRALLEVEVAGQREWVTVTLPLEGGELRACTSDGRASGAHVDAALAALGLPASTPSPAAHSLAPERAAFRRESLPPPDGVERVDDALTQVAMAFEDLVTAVVRVGVQAAAEAPSVIAARERLVAAVPLPLPFGLARYLGRLRAALAPPDVVAVARLLDEASRFTAAARGGSSSPRARERVRVMLGPALGQEPDTLSDRTFAELGREWVAGVERAGLERRLLVDAASGELYLECRGRQGTISLGPCPRVLRVGLAEVEPGPAPRRVRVMQYEVASGLDADTYAGIEARAERCVAQLIERYQAALEAYPGMAEPFAIFAPARITREPALVLLDGEGAELPLRGTDDEGRGAALLAATDGVDPEWLVGSLHEREGRLSLDPWGFGHRAEGSPSYLRLR